MTDGAAEPSKPLILVVEDEPAVATMLRYNLEKQGFRVDEAGDGGEALTRIAESRPDLVLLDWMLPIMSGIEVCRQVRRNPHTADLPVIMLTARADDQDAVRGLNTGADDYITKPFSQRLLVARIRAILRRTEIVRAEADEPSREGLPEPLVRGQLLMDPARHHVEWAGRPVSLTVTEFLILEAMAQRPGVVKSRNQLMDAAYSDDVFVDDRTIDSHIKRLRRKFRAVDPQFSAIETLYGAGYSFTDG